MEVREGVLLNSEESRIGILRKNMAAENNLPARFRFVATDVFLLARSASLSGFVMPTASGALNWHVSDTGRKKILERTIL